MAKNATKKTQKAVPPKEEAPRLEKDDGMALCLDITPDMCRKWLDNMERYKEEIGYRRLSPRTVRRYTRVMEAKRWIVNGDTLAFAQPSPQLPIMEQVNINGGHRLSAGLASGVTFRSWCIFGLPVWTRKVTDIGPRRTAGNVLQMECHDLRGEAHAAILQVIHDALLGHAERMEPDEVIEMFTKTYSRSLAFVDSVTRAMGKKLSRTPVLAAFVLAYHSKPGAVSEFVERYIGGGGRETDPEMLLRKYVEERVPVVRDDRQGLLLKALQALHARVIGYRPRVLGGGADGLEFFRPKGGK